MLPKFKFMIEQFCEEVQIWFVFESCHEAHRHLWLLDITVEICISNIFLDLVQGMLFHNYIRLFTLCWDTFHLANFQSKVYLIIVFVHHLVDFSEVALTKQLDRLEVLSL